MNLDERMQKDLSPDIYCLAHNELVNLQQENKQLKEVIDKAIKMIDECACYNEKDKECKCNFSSMAMTTLRNILNEVQ